VKAYEEKIDVHQLTADACSCGRQTAKTINFGLMYRMSSKTLAKQLKIDKAEADAYLISYFELYNSIENFYKQIINEAHRYGFIRTLYGRKRRLTEQYHHRSRGKKYHEMTSIINSKIQGSSADIMKYSMIKMFEPLKLFGARILLTVHDEVVVSVPEKNVLLCCKIIEKTMVEAAELSIPTEIDIRIGKNWGEAKHGLTPAEYEKGLKG